MSDIFSTFDTEVKTRHKEMLDELESISVEDLKSEGVSLTFGGKTFKLTDLEIIKEETVEEKLRKEFKEKLNSQQQRIRDKINEKINQLLVMHQNKQQELDRKEKAMKLKYSSVAMMPEITENHMLRGLSVVKGNTRDGLLWIYRGIYNPRFLIVYSDNNSKQRKPLPSRLVNRMKKNILLLIKTKGKNITSVDTHVNSNSGDRTLPRLNHYHQTGTSDCWGSWTHQQTWETPDDIMQCAKDAEAVLETINSGSYANRGPSGLPRSATLEKAVKDIEHDDTPTTVERAGGNDIEDDVWQTI